MSRFGDALQRAGDIAPEHSLPLHRPPIQSDAEGALGPIASLDADPPSAAPAILHIAEASSGNPIAESSCGGFTSFNPRLAGRLVGTLEMSHSTVEQYRKLAATVHHLQIERGLRVFMVTSAVPGEGKTLTAANLALTLSESYRRQVLLIDADLRRPAVCDVFQLPNVVGLSDALRAPTERKMTAVRVSNRLAVLPAGRPDPDPMSGLTSERMRRLLKQATAMFDWVIIDTPPVGLLPDANLLVAMADGALLVIAAGMTRYQLIQRAVQALGRDRIIGVVLNRTNDGFAAPYYTYSDYYGGDR